MVVARFSETGFKLNSARTIAARRWNWDFFFLIPALSLFATFVLYPFCCMFFRSVYQWDGVNPATFVGFKNFIDILTHDYGFWLAMRNALYWAPLTIVPQMVLGFGLAYILTSGVPFESIFRAIIYFPAIVSPIVVGIVWQRIYNPFGGLLSDAGAAWHVPALMTPFLADPKIAIFSVIVVNIWQWTGYSMVLYVAGLNTIPEEILEAATLDGAGAFKRITRIIWPMLRHVHLTLILLGIIGTLQTFPLIYIMTQGGPNHATEMLPNYIFTQAFRLQAVGYASALSVILLLLALGLSIFQMKVFGSRFAS
jgi:multiple sugar transport system permease protein/raffinose/stachyose/melibiose transport system permease protein